MSTFIAVDQMQPLLAFIGMPGPLELIVVLAILLLLFGNRLPSVMRSLGKGITVCWMNMKTSILNVKLVTKR